MIAGEFDETTARHLNGGERNILKRGQSDSFLLAVPRPLGNALYMRVWHDNSGSSEYSSWFLNYVVLRDLQSREKFYFVVNKWLAVEEGDGKVGMLQSYELSPPVV